MHHAVDPAHLMTVFLCGDVMIGRGLDQMLPHLNNPHLYESYIHTTIDYVRMAEAAHSPIPKPVDFAYIWGDAREAFARIAPDARIINLETAVTTSDHAWPGKGIHYRVHPENIPCLTIANIDCCGLSNNHVLDWGDAGLAETLETLRNVGVQTAGAGRDVTEAKAPAVMHVAGKGRVLVWALGAVTSGIPRGWAATEDRPGVHLLTDVSDHTVQDMAGTIQKVKRHGDIVVASLHWGGHWGYDIPHEHSQFAHQLLDEAGVDIVHGHSSHHPKDIEVYRDKPIIYGSGDCLNDYEGIRGYETFRDDLVLMYCVTMEAYTGKLDRFEIVPMQIKRFRAHRVTTDDAQWLQDMLHRESDRFGTRVERCEDNTLTLQWS